jgi:hypothetical protein
MAAPDLAAAREHWIAQGLDAAAFDAAAGVTPPAHAPSPTTAPTSEASQRVGDFMPPHVAQGARDLLLRGTSEAQIRGVLADQGYSKAAIDGALADAPRETNKDLAALNAGGLVGARPDEYSISYPRETLENVTPAQLATFDGELRQAMSDMGVPKGTGGDLGALIAKASAEYLALPTEGPAREAYRREQEQRLISAMGLEKAREAHKLAAAAFSRIKSDAFAEHLVTRGALHSAWVVQTLASAADIQSKRDAIAAGTLTLGAIAGALQ